MSVYGDGSQHRIRFCIRDSVDNDLFVSAWHSVDFSGWRSLSWNLASDPMTAWVTGGNGLLDGTQAEFDSIQIEREASGPGSGHLYFDQLAASGSSSSGGDVAAIQWGGSVVYMGFPFETLEGEEARSDLMARVVDYFGLAGDASVFSDGFESGDTSAWSSQSSRLR